MAKLRRSTEEILEEVARTNAPPTLPTRPRVGWDYRLIALLLEGVVFLALIYGVAWLALHLWRLFVA